MTFIWARIAFNKLSAGYLYVRRHGLGSMEDRHTGLLAASSPSQGQGPASDTSTTVTAA